MGAVDVVIEAETVGVAIGTEVGETGDVGQEPKQKRVGDILVGIGRIFDCSAKTELYETRKNKISVERKIYFMDRL